MPKALSFRCSFGDLGLQLSEVAPPCRFCLWCLEDWGPHSTQGSRVQAPWKSGAGHWFCSQPVHTPSCLCPPALPTPLTSPRPALPGPAAPGPNPSETPHSCPELSGSPTPPPLQRRQWRTEVWFAAPGIWQPTCARSLLCDFHMALPMWPQCPHLLDETLNGQPPEAPQVQTVDSRPDALPASSRDRVDTGQESWGVSLLPKQGGGTPTCTGAPGRKGQGIWGSS